jgi:hypothetical protein
VGGHRDDRLGPRQQRAQRRQESPGRQIFSRISVGDPCDTNTDGIDIASILAQHLKSRNNEVVHAGSAQLAILATVYGHLLRRVAMAQTTLRLVAHSDLKVLDPIWTTAFITRNHGYMIYDVLFAKDAKASPAADGRQVRGLAGQADLDLHPARRPRMARRQAGHAEDCVASIKRWAARDALGQQLMGGDRELRCSTTRASGCR